MDALHRSLSRLQEESDGAAVHGTRRVAAEPTVLTADVGRPPVPPDLVVRSTPWPTCELTTKSSGGDRRCRASRGGGRPQPGRAAAPALDPARAGRRHRCRPVLDAVGVERSALAREVEAGLTAAPSAMGASVQSPSLAPATYRVLRAAWDTASKLGDEFLSTEHLLVGLAADGGPVADLLAGTAPPRTRCSRRSRRSAARDRVTSPDPEGTLPGAGEVRRRPDRRGPRGQARPGHRPRHRDPPGRAGAVPADQEQPGADRRARRRQDRGRRGSRPADRGRRRAGVAAGQAADRARPGRDGRRREVPRRVRGAAQGRPRRDQGLRRPGRHVHRRAAHRRRRRRDRRARWTPATCSSRCWPAASCGWSARPRWTSTASTSRRTPPWSAGSSRCWSASPASRTRSAILRGLKEPVRGAPPGADRRLRAGRRRDAVRPLHHRPVPAGQGHRPGRRGRVPAADGDRLPAGRDRRAAAGGRPAEDGGAGAGAGDRRRPRSSGWRGCAATWPTGRSSWPR